MKKSFFIFFILIFCRGTYGQEIIRQDLFWNRLMVQSQLNSKWFLINEVDNRRFFDGGVQHHTIQHNHIHYRIKPNMDIAWGQTFSWQSPHSPDAENKLVVPEIRPFQEFNASATMPNHIVFSSRIRIDERFTRKNNGMELLNGYNFNMRYRWRIQYAFFMGSKKRDNLKISNELMVNSGKNVNFFDQNRIYIGFEKVLSKTFTAEIGYLRWFQQRQKVDTYFQRDIIRFTLLSRFDFKKK